MAKKLTKEDLSTKGILHNIALGSLAFYQNHKKLVIFLLGFLVLGGIFFKVMYDKKKGALLEGFKALYVPMSEQEKITKLELEKVEVNSQEINIEEIKSQVKLDYDKLLREEHPDQVMIFAALNLADIHRKNGDIDAAISAFSNVNLDGKYFLSGLGAMMLASLYEESANCDRALELWDEVIKKFSFFRTEALLKKALCLEDSDMEQALDIYTRLSVDSPDTSEGVLAKKLLMIKRGK